MNLIWRTLKSFTRKEKLISGILVFGILASGYAALFSGATLSPLSQAKTYSEGVVGELKHLNPVFTEFSEADTDACSLIFSGLAKYNAATGEFDEDIATHTLSEDQKTYTFTLKNDVYWQDGTEVTSDDIYFTFAEVIQSADFENTVLKSNFDGVEIEQTNSRTVTFTLNQPNYFFFTSLTVGLLPKHILGEVPVSDLDTHEFNKMPMGTGPYMVTDPYEVFPDGSTSVTLAVSSDYYGETPSIESLRFVAYPSVDQLIENRSVWHGAARIRASQLDDITDLENLVSYQYELPQYTALFLNTDADFLSQNKERLGIAKAIDKTEILESIDYKVAVDTPLMQLNQDEWLHISDQEEAMGALFDAGWTMSEPEDSESSDDSETSDESSEEVSENYRTNEDGETMTLRLVRRDFTGSNESQEETMAMTAHIIQEQLEDVGVEVIIETYSLTDLQTIITERDYDMLLYGQSLGYNLDTFSYWHSSQADDSGLNLSNYQNAKADFYIESIRAAFDAEERQELLEGLASIMAADIPAVFLYTPSYYYLVDKNLIGLTFENLLRPRDRFSNIAQWNF
jgi:peptide/nickel transport system substrate-binding protein